MSINLQEKARQMVEEKQNLFQEQKRILQERMSQYINGLDVEGIVEKLIIENNYVLPDNFGLNLPNLEIGSTDDNAFTAICQLFFNKTKVDLINTNDTPDYSKETTNRALITELVKWFEENLQEKFDFDDYDVQFNRRDRMPLRPSLFYSLTETGSMEWAFRFTPILLAAPRL